jgi:hypothetical protein
MTLFIIYVIVIRLHFWRSAKLNILYIDRIGAFYVTPDVSQPWNYNILLKLYKYLILYALDSEVIRNSKKTYLV